MHLVILHLSPTAGAAYQSIDPADARHALQARAEPTEALEHLSARRAARGLDVGLFYRTETEESARDRAERLARRAVADTPIFAGWRIDDITRGALR
nr:hypothetical protein GCM10020063_030160 [Dactylosporangium thailandense]